MSEQPKLHVLVSTYNGEKYVAQQLDSILNQTYSNFEIYVRDDGSTDGTVSILRGYEEAGKIHLELGENKGFVGSFQWLIVNGGEADYYAFADQDDEWLPEKLTMAVEKLADASPDEPTLYFSNYDFYDGEMNFVKHHESNVTNISFVNSLVDCISLGFNSVFNAKARQLAASSVTHWEGHDWWMYMLCTAFGRVIYDDRPTVKYRRHGNNVSDGGANFWKFQVWRFKRLFVNNQFAKIRQQLKGFAELFMEQLKQEDQRVLRLFILDGFHPLNTLKKTIYPHRYRQGLIDELMVRTVILLGRL